MNEEAFRTRFCELIQYYQLIEYRLKGICAVCYKEKGKTWIDCLSNYDFDPMGVLIQKLKEYKRKTKCDWITERDFCALDEIRMERNYWCHDCFTNEKHSVIFRKGELRDMNDGIRLSNAYRVAVDWDVRLTEIHCLLTK